MSLAGALTRAAAALDGAGRGWCVVGGVAVSARVAARFTADVDVVVRVDDDADAEALTLALLRSGYTLVAAIEHESTGHLASAQLLDAQGIPLDVIFALVGIEADIVADAEPLEVLDGQWWRAARVGHLVAMKLLSVDAGRPDDAGDLLALLRACDATELARARVAVDGILAAGAARGRDLHADLTRWLSRR